MRGAIALAAILVACSAPNASPSATPPPSAAAIASPSPTPAPSLSPAAQPTASPPITGLTSAGAVADAGILFISDFGPPDANHLVTRTTYRYDGATGTLARLPDGPLSTSAFLGATGFAHDGEAGVYIQGANGRWDLIHWDGTRASDQEFTACQVRAGYFASWCRVTPKGVGLGYGTHVGLPCGAPQFIRFPGDAAGRPLPPELCISSAWLNDDATVVVANGLVVSAPAGGPCASPDLRDPLSGACYRAEIWVIPIGGTPRKLPVTSAGGVLGDVAISPDGRYATTVRGAAPQRGALALLDLATGVATPLGSVIGEARWSADGRVAFVRGAGAFGWTDRSLVVASTSGAATEVRATAALPVSHAPSWDPSGKRLAWIAAPAATTSDDAAAADHLAGRGVGDRRVFVSELVGGSPVVEIRCGEGVAEGVRWSHDGSALLILCRRPGLRLNAFDLWSYPLDLPGGHQYPLVRGLTLGGVDPNGDPPDLFSNTAWSRGLKIAP